MVKRTRIKIIFLTIFMIVSFTAISFAGEVNFYVYDNFGKSVVSVVNISGTVVANYKYDAFGKVNSEIGSVSNTHKYNGEQNDPEIKLIYLRNRYYDPSVGRFITKDINRGIPKNPQTVNPYPYCNSNPISLIDATGDFPILLVPAVVGAVYGAGSTLVGDLINSSMSGHLTFSSGATYIGNTAGGIAGAYAAAGAALVPFLAPASGVIGGSVGGAVSNITTQLLTPNHQFSWGEVGKESGIGGISGLIGGLGSKNISGLSPFDLSRGFGANSNTNLMTAFFGAHGVQQAGTNFVENVLGFGFGQITNTPDVYNRSNWNSGPTELWSASSSPHSAFGGVSLSKTATLLLNVQDVGGATYDQATGQVILYGKHNVALPDMNLDDLAVAVSSEYGLHKSAANPGVSIGTEPSDLPGQMKVRFDGDTLNTNFGSVMFNSDRLLKTLTLGQDNITGAPVSAAVSGYMNMLDRYKAAQYLPPNGSSTRMWFTPKEISLAQSADGSAMEFNTTTMQLLTESKYLENVTGDPHAEAFAAQMTQNYDAYANEFPILQQLTRLGKITAVVKWIKDNNIPFDLSFFSNYVPAAGTTPQYTPQTSVTTSWTSGSTIYSLTITGGVIYKLDASNFASTINPVAATASEAAINARPSDTDFSWNFSAQNPGGNTEQFTAIAQSFTRSQKDGSVKGSKVDVSFPVPGDNSLSLARYYNSFYDKATGFGYGWQITPYAIRFPAKPQSFTFGDNAFTVNAHYQIYVREGQNEYLYTLSGLNIDNKPVYMREGGSYILTDNQNGTLTLNCLNIGKANFNSTGLLTSIMDRNGIAINYAYNGSKLISITHQNGRAITLNYSDNSIMSAVGPASRTIIYTYYPNGQLNTVVDAANQTTTYVYDTDLHLTQIIDPKSNTSYQAVYDDYNRATSQTAGSAQYSSNFNLADSMTTSTDPNNATTTQYFDEDYHLAQSADFLNNTTNIAYDPNNFGPSTVTDANGQVTNYLYDSFGNAWYMKDAKGGQKFFFYDTNRNLVATRNELGNDTVYIYDANNRMIETLTVVMLDWVTPATPTLPPSSINYSYDPSYVTKYTYDPSGNLLSVTDETSRIVNMTYDPNGMPWTVTAPSGYQVIKTYDTLSRLSTVSDPGGGTTSFAYDNADRITKISTTAGSTNYTYDSNGNLETVIDGNNNVTTYGYDSNNNLITVTDAASGVTQYTYDITNKLTRITMPNDAVKELEYDEANRPVMEICKKTSPAPKIGVMMSSINFGSVPAGTPVTNQLTVYNAGDASLNITNVSTDNTSFTVSPQTATIPAGGQAVFNITLTALFGTNLTGNLTIQSNDPDTPSVSISLSGTAAIHALTTNVSSQLNGISVSWNEYQGEGTFDYYAIYRSPSAITSVSGLTPLATISDVATVSYVDNTTVIGAVYYYAVVAFDSADTELSAIQSSGSITFLNFARIGLPVNIANSSNNESNVAEVYNSTSNQFFVVYENDVSGNGSNIDIYGQFVSSTGQLVGSAFPVFNSDHIENKAQVAWNSTINQYMVVCQYTNGSGVTQIEEQRVSATGTLVGGPIIIDSLINSPGVAEITPSIVYNSTENKYLITYASDYAGYGTKDLIVIILDANGNCVVGKDYSYYPNTIQNPKVVFNPQTNQYLVVSGYTNLSNTYDLAVFAINSGGNVISGQIPGLPQKTYLPNVVYNPRLNQYAMVYQYDYTGNGTKYAVGVQTISVAGSPSSSYTYYASGGGSYLGPSLAYNSTNDEYYITFTASTTGSNEEDILGLRISPSTLGKVIQQPLNVASISGKVSRNGVAAYNAADNEFFVAYQYNNGSNLDVRGQMVGVLTQNLNFTPSSLNFGSNLTQQLISQMSGEITGIPVSVNFSADQPWIQLSISNLSLGATTPPAATIGVNIINTSSLGVGSHSGNVNVRLDGITTLIPVTIEVVTLPPNPPANPMPASGAINQANLGTPLKVSMTWVGSDPQSNPLTYNIYFSDNQALVTNLDPSVLVSQNQPASSYTSSALGYNQTYYWRVKAIDNTGLSALGCVWSFTTVSISAPTLIPYSPNPTNNQTPTLTWNAVNGAAHYNVQISSSSNFSSLLVNDSSSTSPMYTPTAALPQGTIYWRVAAIDSLSNVGSFSSGSSFAITLTPPAQVSLIPYTPNPTNNQKPTLTWNAVNGTALYHIQISDTSSFSTLLVDVYVPQANYTPAANLPLGTIYWQVSAKDSAGNQSLFSDPGSLTVVETPATVLNTATSGNAQVVLSWAAVPGATGYSIQYGTASGVYGVPVSVGSVTSYTVSGLTNGTPYYFVVTATYAGGTSGNSNELSAMPQLPAPVAPVLNMATAGNAQVALAWTAVPGSTGYSIQYTTATDVYAPVNVGNVTSYAVSGLTNGTLYYFVVTATNTTGTSGNSNQLNAIPQESALLSPVLNTATAGNTQATLAWGAVTGATSYSVKYGTLAGVYGTPMDVGNLTSYTITGLTNGSPYYFVVTATSALGTSGNSNELNATPLSAPVLNTATPGDTQVTLAWSVVTGAAGYSIRYGTASGVYGAPVNVGNMASYVVSGLTNETQYYFIVTATNAGGASDNSNELNAIPQVSAPTAPILNTATPSNTQVALTWTAVTGATSYSVAYGTAIGAYGAPIVVGDLTSYTVTGLTNGTPYYFVVTATNSGGTSGPSNELSATPAFLLSPLLNTATPGNAQVSLSWTTVPGATSYSVKYGTSSGVYGAPVSVGNLTSYAVTGLANGTKYYFALTATSAGGTSNNSNELNATPLAPPPAPVLTSASGGNAQVVLFWNSVAGATSYSVKYGTATGVYGTTVVAGNTTIYTVTGLAVGTKYYFVVTATNGAATSGNSNELNATTALPPPVLNTTTVNGSNVTLSWTAVPGASSYRIFYGTTSGSSDNVKLISGGTTTSSIVSGLKTGTTYYFRVKAYDSGYYASLDSNELSAMTEGPPPPVLNTATPGPAQMTLSWTAVTGASGYTLYYSAWPNSSSPTSVSVGNVTSSTITGLMNGKMYYFRVAAMTSFGTTGYSNETSSAPADPLAPVLNTAIEGNAQVTLTWTSVPEATGYSVKYGTSPGVYGTPVGVGNVTNFTVTGLTNNTYYYFVVTATSAGGTSGNSNELRARPLPPPPAPVLGSVTPGNATVRLSWNWSSGASAYSVAYGTSSGVYGTTIPVGSPPGASYTVTGLTNGVTYYFVVIATGPGGTSPYSNELSAAPISPPPVPVLNVTVGDSRLTMSWAAVAGADKYNIDVRTATNSYQMYGGVGNVTSYTLTGLTNGTTYYCKVASGIGNSFSDWSNIVAATPIVPPVAPVLTTATRGNAQVALSWTNVSGATSYFVQYRTEAGAYGAPIAVGNLTNYTVTGLTNDTKYYFAVTASNAGGSSGLSNELNATPVAPPAAPVLNTATAGNAQVTLAWAAVTGATSYSIQYGTATGVYGTPVVVGNLTNYTVAGLTNGTPHYFVVTATNEGGTSPISNELNAIPVAPPAAPVLNTATAGNAQVALLWSAVTGATGYSIQYGTASGVYGTPVSVGNVTSYTVAGLTNGIPYYFVVTATNAGGTSSNSNQLNATPVAPPIAPVLNTAMPSNGQIALSWDSVTGVTGYSIQYGTATGVYGTPVVVGNLTNYTVTGLTNGTKYYFVVTATNSGGTSPNSNELNATPQVSTPLAPVLNTATAGNAQATLAWAAVNGATGYSIQYGTASGVYGAPVSVGNVTSYTITGLANGTPYYFVITATNPGGTSPGSNELNATPISPPPVPVLSTATAGNAQVTLAWAAVTGATSYSIKYGTASGVYGAPVDVGNLNSYPITGLTNGEPYYFVVTATNVVGTSGLSNELNATPVSQPAAPILSTATAGNAQVALVWSATTGATSYSVQYGTAAGVYGTPAVVGNLTSYMVTGLPNGTMYYFVVTATNPGGTSPISNELNATPVAPPVAPILNMATPSNTQVALSWDSVTGATSYSIQYGTASGVYGTPVSAGDVTSYMISGLTNGTKYYFVVTATNAGETSGNSNELYATPYSYGYISGMVIDEIEKLSVGSVWIRAYDWNTNELIDSTQTLSDGTYRFTKLPQGSYKIYADTESADYGYEYYDNTEDQNSAAEVIVTLGNTTPGINFILPVLEELNITIHNAFNPVCFAVMPQGLPSPYKASRFIQDLILCGVNVDVVMQWDEGIWVSHQFDLPFTDFDLKLDEGIFVSTVSDTWYVGTWTLKGKKMKLPGTIDLHEGWNLVNMPTTSSTATAIQALQEINSQGGTSDVIMWWDGDWWISSQVDLPFTDQDLVKGGRSYFIRCYSNSRWEMR